MILAIPMGLVAVAVFVGIVIEVLDVLFGVMR